MEKGLNAFFYDFKYYIFPEEFSDITKIEDGTVITAKRLKEVECMAPNFIYESIEEETLEITDKKYLFPVEVNLYSAEEYNSILQKQVDRVCPGCLRYDASDDGSLEGHHREISLNGTCYERDDDKSFASYATRVSWVYDELAKHLDELAECIENKKAAKFDKICKECSKYIARPERFYGLKKDGKYFIACHKFFASELYLTWITYTAYCAKFEDNPLTRAGWQVIPFIPEGAEGYKGKIKDKTCIARLAPSRIPWRYTLELDTEDEKVFADIFRYLSFKIGEDRFFRTIESVETKNSEAPLMTMSEICQKLIEIDSTTPDDSFPPYLPYGWENQDNATSYKRSVSGTSCNFAFADIGADISLREEINFDKEYAYAYVYVPSTLDKLDEIVDVLNYYLNNEQNIPEPILCKHGFTFSCFSIGICECLAEGEEGVAFDFFVADEKMFYRFIKILAPVLSYYNARLVVINSEGQNEYICGEEILPADSNENN